MTNLKDCLFCENNNIEYSVKTAGRIGYHMSMYCKDCHLSKVEIKIKESI